MSDIEKYKELSPVATEIISRATTDEVKVGNVYIRANGSERDTDLYRISEIVEKENFHKETYVEIHYQRAKDWEGTEWSSYGSDSPERFFTENTYQIIPKAGQSMADAIKEHWKAAIDIITNQNFDALEDKSEEMKDNSLVGVGSKQHLAVIESQLVLKKKSVGILKSFVELEMRKRRAELDEVKEKLGGILAEFGKKIKKIQRVISMIELYLGVDEEIVQISEGAKASPETPINFRQQVLFMDEEVGDATDGGWDFQKIEDFDRWLIEDENFKRLAPEEKCVVVFRPRRRKKDYGDKIKNAIFNAANKTTYFLIRNGDCVYRIWAEVEVGKRLFPLRTEFEKLLHEIHEQQEADYTDKRKVEELEDTLFGYQQRAYMLQGLIDRTEVFHPLLKPVSMFKMEEAEGLINFIYDDELALPTGRKPFWEWVKEINSGIKRGSRIVHSGQYSDDGGYTSVKDYDDRLQFSNVGRLPSSGIYEVEMRLVKKHESLPHYVIDELEEKGLLIVKHPERYEGFCLGYETHASNYQLPKGKELKTFVGKERGGKTTYIEAYNCEYYKEIFFIRYNPKDTVYGSWGDYDPHERKKRVSFDISKRDKFIFNYDRISIEDIDFYLQSRTDRPNYAYMMPILRVWKKHRIAEMKWEKEFVEFIKRRGTEKNLVCKTDFDKLVWSAIDWWKHKNIWKRPITKDDALAMRMIERRIFSQVSIKKNFTR